MPLSNRAARRKALQALNRAARRGRMESGSISSYCGHPKCGYPAALGVKTMAEASAALTQHYRDKHGGREPDG